MNAKEGLKKGCRKQNGDWKGARKAREGNAKGQKTEPETEMRRGRDDQAERKEGSEERKKGDVPGAAEVVFASGVS